MSATRGVKRWLAILGIGVAVLWGGRAWAGLPTFNIIQTGFGAGPADEATADFNADAKNDLAVANASGSVVTVWINSGTGFGTAGAPPTLTLGAGVLKSPQGIAVGDFNHDGKPDIAVSNNRGKSVTVFLNTSSGGTASFGGPITTNLDTTYPLGIAAINTRGGSSPDDLVVAVGSTSSSGKLSLLFSNGDGTFTIRQTTVVGNKPTRVAVGDFGAPGALSTPDGKPDVAVTLNGAAKVAVLYNNYDSGTGTGGLTASASLFPCDGGPRGIVAADMNNDGCLDLVTANHNGSTLNTVDVLFGCDSSGNGFSNGQGMPTPLSGSTNPYSVAVADINEDTKKDIVATDNSGDSALLLRNDMDLVGSPRSARFTLITSCPVDNGPQSVVTADFDGDNRKDIAVGNRSDDDISIITNPGIEMVACGPTVAIGQKLAKKLVSVALCNVTDASGTGDPDAGGILDLLLLDQSTGNVIIFGNDGAGNFTKGATITPPAGASTATTVACASHQNNSPSVPSYYDDFAVTYKGSDSADLFCNFGSTTFYDSSASTYCPSLGTAGKLNGPLQIVYGDFDAAGKLDFTIVNGATSGTNSNSVFFSTMNADLGTGTGPVAAAVGRFLAANNDVAVANAGDKNVSTYTNSPLGTFTANGTQSLGITPTSIADGDIKADTFIDIVTANKGSDNVSVFLSSGGGSYQPHAEYAAGNGPVAVVIGDYDIDGSLDVAVADSLADVISVLPGNKTNGALTACTTSSCQFIGGDLPIALASGNLNNDSYPDIVAVDQGSGGLTILLNAYVPPPPTPTPCVSCPTPTPPPGPGC